MFEPGAPGIQLKDFSHPLVFIGLIAAALVGCDDRGGSSDELDASQLAEMVWNRIDAGDIPDHGLPHAGDSLFLVDASPPGSTRTPLRSELFEGIATRVIVTSLESLRQLSRSLGNEPIVYLSVAAPVQLSPDTWIVRLGFDYAVADPEPMRLCCCTNEAVFRVVPNGIEFLRWGVMMCA